MIVSVQVHAAEIDWEQAERNGERTQEVIKFCNRFVWGWLTHADPSSGLIPRNLKQDFYWNARDAAADNYPFMVLTAAITDNPPMRRIVRGMLETERAKTSRLDSLPDDFLFETQTFRMEQIDLDSVLFGASEYCKDGLMPITEWIGPSPWLDRMEEMIRDIWKHAPYDSQFGKIPSQSGEVNGNLLQVTSRLYWMGRDPQMLEWVFRLADHYFLDENILEEDKLGLDDHACEIIGGLAEAYLIASKNDPERWEKYRPSMHAILDRILAKGANEDGLLYNRVNPRTGEILSEELTDNWGYNYNAFLTVAEVDSEVRYRQAVEKVLANIHQYTDYKWEGGGADGYADSIEGGINLLNRIPVESAFQWVEDSMEILLAKQRHDGIVEGWHGDGNSARTAILYALMKTQGVTVSPWRADMKLGAVRLEDGGIAVYLGCEWPWTGSARFDIPRHSEYFRMPYDYPRLNQFAEWFAVEDRTEYEIRGLTDEAQTYSGRELRNLSLKVAPEENLQMVIRKK
jgi:hypothetical protein